MTYRFKSLYYFYVDQFKFQPNTPLTILKLNTDDKPYLRFELPDAAAVLNQLELNQLHQELNYLAPIALETGEAIKFHFKGVHGKTSKDFYFYLSPTSARFKTVENCCV